MTDTEYTSAPGGSGAGSGVGETFSVNLSTGTAMHTYKLAVPAGVANHTPTLSLQYTNSSVLGPFGLGWQLTIRSITAGLDFGAPNGDGLLQRILDNGAEIVATSDHTYRALRETAFDRYTRSGDGWQIEARDGLVHQLGTSAAARVTDPDNPARVVEWWLEHSTDSSGNSIKYTYQQDGGYAYPSAIRYARYEIRFAYEQRTDARRNGRTGFARRQNLRCVSVHVVLDPGAAERIIRSWDIGYALAPASQVSLLETITMTSHGLSADGSEDVRRPPTTFGYGGFDVSRFVPSLMTSAAAPPPPLGDADVALVTLDNAPLPGVLVNRDGHEYYWPNTGNGGWDVARPLRRAPLTRSFGEAGLAFVDMDGSGTADLMAATAPVAGYYENDGRDGWGTFVAYPRANRVSPTWTDPSLRLTDTNGDGLVDAMRSLSGARGGVMVWGNGGRDGWLAPVLAANEDLAGLDLASADVYLADMTGDGLDDLVRVRSGAVEYWPSLGRGRFGDRVVMANSPRISHDTPWSTVVLVDIDGDGCADLVILSGQGLSVVHNRNGIDFAAPSVLAIGPPPLPGSVRVVNMTGRASAGLVWNARSDHGARYVQWQCSTDQPAYLLSQVDNGAGLVSRIAYRSAIADYQHDRGAGRMWTTNFPFPYIVVSSTTEIDRVSGRTTERQYSYHEAHFETRARQFQGFRSTERITKGDASRADTREVFEFLMAQERVAGNGPEHAQLNGLLARVETFSDDGSPQSAVPLITESGEHNLTVLETLPDGRARAFVFVVSHRVEDHERSADVRVEERTYTYDAVGNVVRESRLGSGTAGGLPVAERTEVRDTEYATSVGHYLLDRVSRSTLRDGAGTLLSEQRIYYDGPDFAGLPLGQAGRGLKSQITVFVLSADAFAATYAGLDAAALGYSTSPDVDGHPAVFASTQRTRYDARGLATGSMDALGVVRSSQFDDAGLFRVADTDALGTSTFTYDAATGQMTKHQTPDGAMTVFVYDAQGRVVRAAPPGADIANPPCQYAYDETATPNRRTMSLRQADGSIVDHVSFYDGGGREVQQRATVGPGKILVSGWNVINPWGAVAREFEPTFAASLDFAVPANIDGPGAPPSRSFFFDGRGRAVRCLNYNGGISRAEFLPFQVTTYDANDTDNSAENVARGQFSTPHIEQFDVFRDVVRVADTIDATSSDAVTYQVGPQGEILSVADTAGVKLSYTYDQRGCRLTITSREAGVRRIYYDAAKRAVRTVDGAGHELEATWDSLGRQLTLSHDGATIENYTYDTAASNALGRLAAVTYTGGSQEFSYDVTGRLARRTYHFDGEAVAQTLDYEYDPCGRARATVYPDGQRVERTLTGNGWVSAISGVVHAVDYDPRGVPLTLDLANGVRTVYEYTPGPGRVSRQLTTSASRKVLQDISYTYDKLEVLLATDDTAPGGAGRRAYSYDPLYQLTGVDAVEAGVPVHYASQYSGLRNLSRLDESHATMHFDDAAHPDRIAGITIDGQARFDAGHDGGGNLAALPGRQFQYNVKNELINLHVDGGVVVDYAYDHTGLRVSKRVDDGHGAVQLTNYLGTHAEIRAGVLHKLIAFAGLRIAVVTGANTFYLHNNPTGTSTLFTDATGERIGELDLHPFGNEGTRSGTVDFQSFGLHPVDPESGLVYMRRRYYSPEIGRFLTPDLMALHQPEKFIHRPSGLHLYAYVANDPMNRTDPEGLSFWSIVGAVVGIAVGVVVGLAIIAATGGLGLVAFGIILGVSLAVTGVSYLIASEVDPNSAFGQFVRGFMIGFNAGLNGVLVGGVAGTVLGVIDALAAIDGVARNSFYQGVLGWSSWLMPMSWAATALGAAFYVFNLVAAGVTGNQWSAAKIDKLGFDWNTGTFVMLGGLIRNGTAFSMGHFVLMDPSYVNGSTPDQTYDAVLRHETGHTLENGAFGSAFLAWDFVGENVAGAGGNDYGEEIAESHANRPGRPTIPMWG